MKNASLILNVVLIIAVVVLYALYFTDSEDSKDEKEDVSAKQQTDSLTQKGINVAYVNIDTVLSEYKLYQEMQEMYKQKQQQMQANLQTKRKKFNKKMADFRNKVQKHLITSTQAKQMQKQLTKEQENLMKMQKQMQTQLAEHEQSMMQQVYDSLQSFITDYNLNRKYDIILSNSYTSTLLYGEPRMNITMEVLNGINKRYMQAQEQSK